LNDIFLKGFLKTSAKIGFCADNQKEITKSQYQNIVKTIQIVNVLCIQKPGNCPPDKMKKSSYYFV